MSVSSPVREILVAASAAALLAFPAAATDEDGEMVVYGEQQEVRTAEISLSGFNPADASAVKIIGGKIRGAAKRVCSEADTHPMARVKERRCFHRAHADGMAQLAALAAVPERFAELKAIRIGK